MGKIRKMRIVRRVRKVKRVKRVRRVRRVSPTSVKVNRNHQNRKRGKVRGKGLSPTKASILSQIREVEKGRESSLTKAKIES